MKTVHRAVENINSGYVSALCFKRPRRIDINKSVWTYRDEDVSCAKCLAEIAATRLIEDYYYSEGGSDALTKSLL